MDMPATHTTTNDREVAMSALHTTTVIAAEPETAFKDGAYTLACTCGERVTYAGKAFTQVEAQRHAAWHAKAGR